MIKILFLINTLGGGGAERVLVNLVNNMDSNVFDITVETMFAGGVNQTWLKPDIKYICKNALTIKGISHIYKFLPSGYLYKRFICNTSYDIIVGYMHNLPVKVITGCNDKSTKKVGWCHCGSVRKNTYCTCWHTKKAANDAYNKCDAIVGVSKRVIEEFQKFFNVKTKCITIYNTNDTAMICEKAQEKTDIVLDRTVPCFCTVGRLSFEKGYDRLLMAANYLAEQGYAFNLYFLGEGIEKKSLVEESKKLQINDKVHFLGFLKNPYVIIKECDVFVCSSREEGLSTAVTEAIILGKPVISTDVSGAKELLGEQNEYGLVVDNSTEGIINGMKAFMDDGNLMQHYQRQAKKRASHFETAKTVQQAEDLFISLLTKE